MKKRRHSRPLRGIRKSPTGIAGFDEITGGGLPTGRTSLVCGSAGCGKTLFSMEFLVHGAVRFGEAGVFMAFEETGRDLTENVQSLGFELDRLVARKKLFIDHVHIERSEIEETGEYDLEGLFIRIQHAIRAVGARRVVLDTVEAIFGGFPNDSILRAELRRLFRWLKEQGVTAIVTGERGDATLTRHGIEEYVSDCVIVLDHRVTEQMSTRRLRVVKYRGSNHGTNEYPFLIDDAGISVMPVTSLGLGHNVSRETIASGIPGLDAMVRGGGFFRGSGVLISGTAGTGKTSIAAHFANAACRSGERCLYFLHEESPAQMARNMESIGLNLGRWTRKGLLQFYAARPSLYGLEMHLATSLKVIETFKPSLVVIDPISCFERTGVELDVNAMLVRLVDHLKSLGITAVFTNLTHGGTDAERTDAEISSLIDAWLLLRTVETEGERNRVLHLLKARGLAHSHQVREFWLTDNGVTLAEVYVGPGGVLTGSARLAQESRDKSERLNAEHTFQKQLSALERRRQMLEAQINGLRAECAAAAEEATELLDLERRRREEIEFNRSVLRRSRDSHGHRDGIGSPKTRRKGGDT